MKIEYILFNVVVFFGPLILSFVPFIFSKRLTLKEIIVAIPIPAFIFIIWDFLVTGYFWNFNSQYILGYNIGGVPVEELLFFFTVPYSCLFLWKNWKDFIKNDVNIPIHLYTLLTMCGLALLFFNLPYTVTVCIVFILIILLDTFLKTYIFNSRRFQYFIGVIILLTFISNGYLTARPIVTYNQNLKTNIMITTIPVEDFLYGIALIAFVVILYEHNKKQF